jgi:hypothetical protein
MGSNRVVTRIAIWIRISIFERLLGLLHPVVCVISNLRVRKEETELGLFQHYREYLQSLSHTVVSALEAGNCMES